MISVRVSFGTSPSLGVRPSALPNAKMGSGCIGFRTDVSHFPEYLYHFEYVVVGAVPEKGAARYDQLREPAVCLTVNALVETGTGGRVKK